jgi:DNA-binding NarL/FixJ family response regulator
MGRLRPDVPVIVLSASEERSDVVRALNLGALGYVSKSASPPTLLSAINLVMNGEIYVPPFVLDAKGASPEPEKQSAVSPRLTQRQIEVLRLMSEGDSNKAIAARLGLSEKTVKIHIAAVFRALDVDNRTQASAAARRSGLI